MMALGGPFGQCRTTKELRIVRMGQDDKNTLRCFPRVWCLLTFPHDSSSVQLVDFLCWGGFLSIGENYPGLTLAEAWISAVLNPSYQTRLLGQGFGREYWNVDPAVGVLGKVSGEWVLVFLLHYLVKLAFHSRLIYLLQTMSPGIPTHQIGSWYQLQWVLRHPDLVHEGWVHHSRRTFGYHERDIHG